MALRKGDFIEGLWLRYALRPPQAVARAEESVTQRLVRFQIQARTDAKALGYEPAFKEFYEDGRVSTVSEGYMEETFQKPWELQAQEPTPVQLQNLAGVDHLGKSQRHSILTIRHSQLPVLTLENVEEWWEYQEFRRFAFDQQYFTRHFYNWYRHTVEDGRSYVYYDPIWSVSPYDRNFELYLYYYLTTVKKLRGWKSPVPLYLIYRKTRPWLYIVFGILALFVNQAERYTKRKFGTVPLLSEDFWMSDIRRLQHTLKVREGVSFGLLATANEVLHAAVSPVLTPMMEFFIGPDAPRQYALEQQRLRTLADRDSHADYVRKTPARGEVD